MFQHEPNTSLLELFSNSDSDEGDSASPAPDEQCCKLSCFSRLKSFMSAVPPGDHDSTRLCEDFLSSNVYTAEERDFIEERTQGQANNPTWSEMRRGMITASQFHRVASRMRTLDRHPEQDASPLVKSLLSQASTGGTDDMPAPLAWGRKKEEDARRTYCRIERHKHRRLQVKERGLHIHPHQPYLACSPDGLVTCACKTPHPDRLLEIKCPYTYKEKDPKEAALNWGCEFHQGGVWSLKTTTPYYSQIQGQLAITGIESCDLVIYTNRGIVTITVPYDPIFYQTMEDQLRKFFFTYLFVPSVVAAME